MSQHTPGPWELEHIGEDVLKCPRYRIIKRNDLWIHTLAEVWDPTPFAAEGTGLSNARLMTAAPELKQLLEGCVGYLMSLPNTQRPDAAWFAPISRLLAKIEGGQHE